MLGRSKVISGILIKELFRGLKWVAIALGVVAILIGLWLGCAWGIGWTLNHFYDLKNFGPHKYFSLGSCTLVFTLIIQVVTVIIVAWFLMAYGRANGIIGSNKKSE